MSEEVFRPIYPYLSESVCKRARIETSKMKVIDLGGGSGLWLEAMLDKGAAAGTVIDASDKMTAYALERIAGKYAPSKFSAKTGSADSIPLPDSSHNVIISRSSMHMWKNLENCWQEMLRVLESDGIAFLGRGYGPDLPDEVKEQVKAARKEMRAQNPLDAKEEPPSPDPFELARMAMKIGFKEVSLIKADKVVWILARK
jgi:ubiquinone/menaquinone biosynthesis C-methylase UbiE